MKIAGQSVIKRAQVYNCSVRRHGLWASLYDVFAVLLWIFGIASASIGACLKADPAKVEETSPFVAVLLASVQETAWLTLPIAMLALGILTLLRKYMGPPWVWTAIKSLLDDFRDHVFKEYDSPIHYHRATLFKFKRVCWRFWKWPWSGWLIPIERSGYSTRKKVAAFKAPDNADEAEGLAGATWALNRVFIVHGLPNLRLSPSNEDIVEYARKTGLSGQFVRETLPQARSFCGIPLEVRGKMWGVIMLDSRNEAAIGQNATDTFRLIGRYFGKLLEKA